MRVSALRRHPVKGLGFETVETVDLEAGLPFPGDRAFAVAHAGAPDRDGWMPKAAFLQGMSGPALSAIRVSRAGEALTFTHPERPALTVTLPGEGDALVAWLRPLWPEGRPEPSHLHSAPERSLADNGQAMIHIIGQATLDALSDAAGRTVEAERFRPNVVLADTTPWEELEWTGRTLTLGGAMVKVVEPTGRCKATHASTTTGTRDLAMLDIIERLTGGTDVGIYARVVTSGTVSVGDEASL